MLIGHLADIHLGAKLYGRQELREDTLKAFRESIDLLIKERVDVILIAGDLFDRPRPENTFILEAIKTLRKATEKGIRVILAAGDHDTPKLRDRSPLELIAEALDGVYYPILEKSSDLNSLIIELNKVKFVVTPFPRGSSELKKRFFISIIPALAKITEREEQKRSILLGHFGVDEACRWDAVLPASMLPRNFYYIALGHVHSRVISRGCRDCPVFAYPGSLYPLKIDEAMSSQTRGPLIVDISSDEPIIHQPKIEVRRHYVTKLSFNSESTLKERIKAAILSYTNKETYKPVIHLDIEIPNTLRILGVIRNLISELERNLDVIIVYRLIPQKKVFGEGKIKPNYSKEIDEIDLVSKFLNGNRTLSKLVVELKNAIAYGNDIESIRNIMNEILDTKNYELWKKILRGSLSS